MKGSLIVGDKSLICPVCGKSFVPAPYHVYKSCGRGSKYVCSYTCAVKSERENKAKRTNRGGRRPSYAYILPSGEVAIGMGEAARLLCVSRDRLMQLIARGEVRKILRGDIGV